MEKKHILNTENDRISVSFLATNQIIEENVIKPVEKEMRNGEMVYWGELNNYPQYIEDLYLNVSTFKSIIDGATDYICGNDIILNIPDMINKKGHTIKDIIKFIAKDLVKYGGFALNIVKNKLGTVAEIYYIDFKKVRTNKDHTKFYYTDDWTKSYGRLKCTEIESFWSGAPSSILYYTNDVNYTYPIAPISAAVNSCEMSKMISQLHYNDLNNGFNASYIVNFNNGKPTDEQKSEIEHNFYNKFCGPLNTSRPLLSFNNNKTQETTITKIESNDFDKKYDTLVEYTRQDIFTAFRCSPILFGIEQENIGFNNQEYNEAYQLWYRTFIQPRQQIIKDMFDKIFNVENCIDIEKFNLSLD